MELGCPAAAVALPIDDSPSLNLNLTAGTSYGYCEILLIILAQLFALVTFPLLLITGNLIKIVNDYERIIVFRCGHSRFGSEIKGAGTYLTLPFVDEVRVVDLRTATINLPKQKLLTRDSLSITVDAVVYIHITDAAKSVINIKNPADSTKLLAQTTLRNVLGTKDLLEILAHRQDIGDKIRSIVDHATDPWGVCVERVELTDLILPSSLERAMAAEAEAKREAEAKVVGAQGEETAATALRNAAVTMGSAPGALQLRFFQTLHSIAAEKNSTIVLPFPMDMTTGGSSLPGSASSVAMAGLTQSLAPQLRSSINPNT